MSLDHKYSTNIHSDESFSETNPISNFVQCMKSLDSFYGQVKRQILRYQSPTTGLFPSMSHETNEAVILDSIFCSAAIWAVYQAYHRLIDDDHGAAHGLGQSAVKCMRGILMAWMRQSKDKMELFKANQSTKHALPSKVNLFTGLPLTNDSDYGHLQLDVVSLYILFLVQMINSGLQIIYTMDEVQFVQNLVYYVERAYRTPDFGMWERGSKYNDGTPEIHASSIGMAKSALESINGCNLFGDKGTSWSVIYVDIDAHSRNRSTFETLLPRESSSKNTDAALLPTISWPCFATHDVNLYESTKEKIISRLKTPFGFKRFLRDGYGTVLEQPDATYYKSGETKHFENIECAWPIFCCFLIIDAKFKNNESQLKEYKSLLFDKLLKREHKYGDYIMPKYYYVPPEYVEIERLNPGSSPRFPISDGTTYSSMHLMGQAVLLITQLLLNGLLQINELDPLRRYTPSFERNRNKMGRYSVFQGTASDLVVQVVLIAESIRLQAMMATYGIQTQTPLEVEPVQIWPSSQLVKIYEYLGVNRKLGLKGRPPRPIGSLGTSKLYRIMGQTILCYPLIFEDSDFYLSHDMALLIDDIKNELNFVGKYWRMSGRPTVCIILREEHLRDANFKVMLDLLVECKNGCIKSSNLKVKIGRLQNLISSSCVEHLDFFHMMPPEDLPKLQSFRQLEHTYGIGYQSLTHIPSAILYSESVDFDFKAYESLPTWPNVIEALKNCNTLLGKSQLLSILLKREGPQFLLPFSGTTVYEHIEKISKQAGALRYWSVVRFCSSILQKQVDSISPSITSILVNGKQISLGAGYNEVLIDHPMTPKEIHELIYSIGQDVYDSVLQQEIIIYVGRLIATSLQLFDGIFRIRIGAGLMQAMRFYLLYKQEDESGTTRLEALSPSHVRRLLYRVLTDTDLLTHQKRQIDGCLGRFPINFCDKVWSILLRSPIGILVGNCQLSSNLIITQMAQHDLSFIVKVEEFISQIPAPEYRQILIELLMVIHLILERNPEFIFGHNQVVDLDKLVEGALNHCKKEHNNKYTILQFYSESKSDTSAYFARAVLDTLLQYPPIECKIN